MLEPAGGTRIIVPTYLRTLVHPIYPTPTMTRVAVLDDAQFAALLGPAVAREYGQAYLVDSRRHHVLRGWVLTAEGVTASVWSASHQHRGAAPDDLTEVVATFGGACAECAAVLTSLPKFDQSLVGL